MLLGQRPSEAASSSIRDFSLKNRDSLSRYLFIPCGLLFFVQITLLYPGEAAWGLEKGQNGTSQVSFAKGDILEGIHLLYDRRFDEAEEIFRRVISESPERPAGYFYLAMVTWSRMAAGSWSPETTEEYLKRVDRTVTVARERIGKGKADSYDYFYLGGALGFKGRFELSRGNWLSSYFLATDAIDALNTCLEMDPDNKDVLLGIGIFDYYTARLSGVLKFLTTLFVHKGNKEEGLRKLNIAAREATYSATEAKSMLLHIYLFLEEDFPKALIIARDLSARYDQNPRFKVLEGVSYLRLGMESQFRDVIYDLRQRGLKGSSPQTVSMWERQAQYLETIYQLFHGHYSAARAKLAFLMNHADRKNDPYMVAWPLLKMGMSYDLEGNREEATKCYRRVIDMKTGAGAQFLAQRLLEYPAQKKDPFIGY
jgi:tetratricopeptide (TPR) repeat protein